MNYASNDGKVTRRIIYRVDPDAIVIVEVFSKKTPRTPDALVKVFKKRLIGYDRMVGGKR